MYYFALQQHLQTTYTSAISRHFCEAGNDFKPTPQKGHLRERLTDLPKDTHTPTLGQSWER